VAADENETEANQRTKTNGKLNGAEEKSLVARALLA
jgi:hypothetical protein